MAQSSVLKAGGNNKNVIINGCFEYWQRNTSFPAAATGTYSADRWRNNKSGSSVFTIARDTDVPTSAFGTYSLSLTTTTASGALSAGNVATVVQYIEGNYLRQLKGKNIVMKFWVKSPKTGIHCVSFSNNTSRNIIKEYTVNTANAWEQKTIRFNHDSSGTWDYSTGLGMGVWFMLNAGTTYQAAKDIWLSNANAFSTSSAVNVCDTIGNVFKLADVMMVEDNAAATSEPSFSLAGGDLAGELSLCQRYCHAVTQGTNQIIGPCYVRSVTACIGEVQHPVSMRVPPSLISNSSNALPYFTAGIGDADFTNMSITIHTSLNGDTLCTGVNITNASATMIVGRAGHFRIVSATGYLYFDSEF